MLTLTLLVNTVNALDLEFDKLVCNTSLPAYIYPDKASMTCNGGQTRCTFGSAVTIAGTSKLPLVVAAADSGEERVPITVGRW